MINPTYLYFEYIYVQYISSIFMFEYIYVQYVGLYLVVLCSGVRFVWPSLK